MVCLALNKQKSKGVKYRWVWVCLYKRGELESMIHKIFRKKHSGSLIFDAFWLALVHSLLNLNQTNNRAFWCLNKAQNLFHTHFLMSMCIHTNCLSCWHNRHKDEPHLNKNSLLPFCRVERGLHCCSYLCCRYLIK